MAPAQSLDQMVKGAPAPHSNASASHAQPRHDGDANGPPTAARRATVSDPTSLLPSSPPQMYLNLLILEASLRSQYLTLRARRRQNSFVLTLLGLWMAFFFYLLWLRPRDDGKGMGGSQYWLVDMLQKVGFITGVVTTLLFWATGQWERGMRWPRRWVAVANRGLRGINAKIVVMRGPWWRELAEWARFVVPVAGGLWGGEQAGSSYHFINVAHDKTHALDARGGRPRHSIVEDGKEYAEEDIAPGGDYIKLLLLPKPFTPDFRQNWEMYRAEYWERENERRAELRMRVRARRRDIARDEGGRLWWTGWRGWKRARGFTARAPDVEKSGHAHAHSLGASNSQRKRRPSMLRGRDASASHSRNSSRSTTPTPDLASADGSERRWSSSSTAPPTRPASQRQAITQGTAQSARQPPVRPTMTPSRSSTPSEGNVQWQGKRASMLSTAESMSHLDDTDTYEGAAEQASTASLSRPQRSAGRAPSA